LKGVVIILADVQLTESEIIARLNDAASVKGESLTFSVKSFFLRLLKHVDNDDFGYFLSLSVEDIANVVGMPKRTVTYCLSRLTACDALYVESRRRPQIRRISSSIIGLKNDDNGLGQLMIDD